MKKYTFISSLLFLLLFSSRLNAQQVCMVTADLQQGTNYLVIWDKPWDQLYDTVFIYRKTQGQAFFMKIGARSIENDWSFFKDETSNSLVETYYKISYLDTLNNETPLSPWHKPMILDYTDETTGGTLTWTKYEREDIQNQDWITEYKLYRDQAGFGNFEPLTYWPTGQFTYTYYDYDTTSVVSQYMVEAYLNYCSILKANINTSRSNIKQQFSNAETGIAKNEMKKIFITPNPSNGWVNVLVDAVYVFDEFIVTDQNGKLIHQGKIDQENFSIDLNNQLNGTYFLTIQHGNKMISKTIIKH